MRWHDALLKWSLYTICCEKIEGQNKYMGVVWAQYMCHVKNTSNFILASIVFWGTAIQMWVSEMCSLQWRHNECDGISNHRRLDCSPNRLFRRGSKKTSKLLYTGLCEGKLPVTSGSPSQRTSNAENASIWWRHHVSLVHLIACVMLCKKTIFRPILTYYQLESTL